MAINKHLVEQVKTHRSEHAVAVKNVKHFAEQADTLARQHDALYESLSTEEKAAVDAGSKPVTLTQPAPASPSSSPGK